MIITYQTQTPQSFVAPPMRPGPTAGGDRYLDLANNKMGGRYVLSGSERSSFKR
jgi:hypothetical protein